MKGSNIGTLSVVLRTQNGTKIPVWSLNGQQGTNWIYGQAPIRSTVEYQVGVFLLYVATRYNRNVARYC